MVVSHFQFPLIANNSLYQDFDIKLEGTSDKPSFATITGKRTTQIRILDKLDFVYNPPYTANNQGSTGHPLIKKPKLRRYLDPPLQKKAAETLTLNPFLVDHSCEISN